MGRTYSIYLDDETGKLLDSQAQLDGSTVGHLLGETVRVQVQKRGSEETRPKDCSKCHGELEWHLTAQGNLYAVCLVCTSTFPTEEWYKTEYLH